MATAFTRPIIEGEGISFREYLLRCVRSIGYFVHQREESLDVPPDFKDDDGVADLQERLDVEKARLENFEKMTLEECDAEAEKQYRASRESWEEHVAREKKTRTRYEAMLAKARAWEPPTPSHQTLKDVMISQIQDSIDNDCGWVGEEPVRISAETWKSDWIEHAREIVALRERKLAEAKEGAKARKAWIEALLKALPEP